MAWILAVARNLALMALRQRERQADLSEEEWDAIPAEGPALSRRSGSCSRRPGGAGGAGAADRGAPRRHWAEAPGDPCSCWSCLWPRSCPNITER